MATCRATMEPIGLTTKRSRNKYARERDRELLRRRLYGGLPETS